MRADIITKFFFNLFDTEFYRKCMLVSLPFYHTSAMSLAMLAGLRNRWR